MSSSCSMNGRSTSSSGCSLSCVCSRALATSNSHCASFSGSRSVCAARRFRRPTASSSACTSASPSSRCPVCSVAARSSGRRIPARARGCQQLATRGDGARGSGERAGRDERVGREERASEELDNRRSAGMRGGEGGDGGVAARESLGGGGLRGGEAGGGL
ncbi:hypothetical protein PR002_g28383 [Phytophthora rubi]|uniref:Uncharacterized protein n=2 Tax=Phytophthora rubi TaxID=129364 RepID=A0A6A3HBY8_9STRA|nr:hypothetical protein PR002_g28383 [Phytophthora rubi]